MNTGITNSNDVQVSMYYWGSEEGIGFLELDLLQLWECMLGAKPGFSAVILNSLNR